MNSTDINNFFGDMDIFLMDAILKGNIPTEGSVLDVGCGEGRNSIYFIMQGYEYLGVDTDKSKINLISHLAKSVENPRVSFQATSLEELDPYLTFDLVICSRVLHFASNCQEFLNMWGKLVGCTNQGGIVYLSMDSVMGNNLGKSLGEGLYEFPDGRKSLALSEDLYQMIKKGFEEIEPIRTLIHHHERAQSFAILRKL